MKQSQIIFIVISLFAIALMTTNPSTAEHKEAVKEKVSAAFENNNSNGNAFQKLGQTIGIALIDKMIKRENYLIFSITKVKLLDIYKNEKVVGYGILGKVYLTNDFSENITENITEKIEEPSNPIIGKTIIIGNLEVAEKDFPEAMSWEDAKKECENLGTGWRLPSIEELTLLYKNKSKIGNFKNYTYWDIDEYENNLIIIMNFDNGFNLLSEKYSSHYVRAVRTIK
jgi:hypothetical protein